MGDSIKRRLETDDEEDFVGFDDSDQNESQDSFHRRMRIKEEEEEEDATMASSDQQQLQTEEEFIALYQNWEQADKNVFPSPGPLGLPFQFGWKRELVFRGTPGVSKEKGDVYYITPQGRKLRTRNEIAGNLTPGLTMDNFSLSKVPLYLGPEYEIVRSAKLKTTATRFATSPREVTPHLGKRIPKPKAPKGASPPPSTPPVSSRGGGSTPASAQPPTKIMKVSSPKTPLTAVNKNIMAPAAGHNSNKRAFLLQSGVQTTKVNPCTIQCRLAQGVVPQLQCVKCYCLYHKECVAAAPDNNSSSYVCEGCCPTVPPAATVPSTTSTATTRTDTKTSSTSGQPPRRQALATIDGRRFIIVPHGTMSAAAHAAGGAPASAQIKVTPKSIKKTPVQVASAVLNGKGAAAKVPLAGAQTPSNLFRTTAMGYDVLLNVFQCLTVKELLRAGRVCRLFHYTASHPTLWRTVRLKNSCVTDWEAFARTLRANGTRHLDMRKMLIPASQPEAMWEQFVQHIGTVEQLERIDLCGRCPPAVVEGLFSSNRQLRVVNGPMIRDTGTSLADVKYLTQLVELRLRPESWSQLRGDLKPLVVLPCLRHLSLTFFSDLTDKHADVLAHLTQLESLELGECTQLIGALAEQVLPQLKALRRLRLERGHTDKELMAAVAAMPALEQLDLINFDIKPDFHETLGRCSNLRKLLVIPTYIAQSATTNNQILRGVLQLGATLRTFTWVVTQELLRVTELYQDQQEGPNKAVELIPIGKPVPGRSCGGVVKAEDEACPGVDMVPLIEVEEILAVHLPDTFITILKEHLISTWRLNIVDS